MKMLSQLFQILCVIFAMSFCVLVYKLYTKIEILFVVQDDIAEDVLMHFLRKEYDNKIYIDKLKQGTEAKPIVGTRHSIINLEFTKNIYRDMLNQFNPFKFVFIFNNIIFNYNKCVFKLFSIKNVTSSLPYELYTPLTEYLESRYTLKCIDVNVHCVNTILFNMLLECKRIGKIYAALIVRN